MSLASSLPRPRRLPRLRSNVLAVQNVPARPWAVHPVLRRREGPAGAAVMACVNPVVRRAAGSAHGERLRTPGSRQLNPAHPLAISDKPYTFINPVPHLCVEEADEGQ